LVNVARYFCVMIFSSFNSLESASFQATVIVEAAVKLLRESTGST